KAIIYSPASWTTANYSTLWGHYGYGWTGVYDPGGTRGDTTIVVEKLVYSVPLDKLLWAGVSTTTNPKSAPEFSKQLIDAPVKEMRKRRFVKYPTHRPARRTTFPCHPNAAGHRVVCGSVEQATSSCGRGRTRFRSQHRD